MRDLILAFIIFVILYCIWHNENIVLIKTPIHVDGGYKYYLTTESIGVEE